MVKINKVYTRTGDDGTTGLVGGSRIKKSSKRVGCYGDIDELNSWLGIIRTTAMHEKYGALGNALQQIQQDLFDIGAELACPAQMTIPAYVRIVSEEKVATIEGLIDQHTQSLPELRSFVLPGGTTLNGYLHLARTVCRRAERSLCDLKECEPVRDTVLHYINRLSDLLFTLARADCARLNAQEFLWDNNR